MPTPYEVLQVDPGASEEVIRAAYRCLAQRCHPDRNPGDPAAGERLSLINSAYELLADPLQRARYDRQARLAAFERRGGGRGLAPARRISGAATMRPFVFRKLA